MIGQVLPVTYENMDETALDGAAEWEYIQMRS